MRTLKTSIFNKKRISNIYVAIYINTRYYLFYTLKISIVNIIVDTDVDINTKYVVIYTFVLLAFILM